MRCSRCQQQNQAGATRCELCGADLSVCNSALPPASAADVPERREATLLFADLGNYTRWTAQADIEDVAAVMDAIKEGAAEIVGAHGGFVNQFVGDQVMAVFGIPEANDDDPTRAVSAALELAALLASSRVRGLLGDGPRLTFHTGIDTGLVLVQRRDIRDGVFDLTGSAVNLAARLSGQAASDEILVSQATHARIVDFFCTEALPPRVLKGIPGEVQPYRIVGRGTARERFDIALSRGLTQYVGRARELGQLMVSLDEAARGQARLVAVEGPPGVGKTRLMHELAERASERGFAVLRGHCQGYGHIPPFQPFLETLEDGLQVRARSPDAAASLIDSARALGPDIETHIPVYLYLLSLEAEGHALPPSLTGQRLRRAVIEALGAALVAIARTRPVLVVVEDWHWADEASDALFRELARATAGHPIMAAVTYRQEQLAPQRKPLSNRQVRLLHFDRAGTRSLLCGLLQSDTLPDLLIDFVHGVTDGNPFFVEEVCHALLDTGALEGSPGAWTLVRTREQLQTPESVHAVVRARIDRLAADDRELLKLASVIGTVFSIDLLDALRADAPCDLEAALSSSLERLEARAHVLNLDPHTYRFRHAIVHEVVYSVLLLRRRRQLHGRLGETIESQYHDHGLESHYEALAHHFDNSDFGDKAVQYAELAGRKAERSASLEQARVQYLRAVQRLDEMTPSPARKRKRVELSLRWASVLVHDPAPTHKQVLQRSLEYADELGDPTAVARCMCWMGWVEYTLGNQQSAIGWNQRCLEIAQQLEEPALQLRVRANIGMSLVMACDYERARAHLSELHKAANVAAANDDTANADAACGGAIHGDAAHYGYAIGHEAVMAGDRGDFAAAAHWMARARAAVDSSGLIALVGALHTMDGMISAFRGDFAATLAAAERVRHIAERIDGAYQRQMAETLEGHARFHAQGDAAGIEQMRGAAMFLERRGIGLTLSWNYACLAEALALAGEADEALAHAESALARVTAGDALGQVTALRAKGIARAHCGDDPEPPMRASLEAAARKDSPREQALVWLRWAALHDDRAQRKELARRAAQRFTELGMTSFAAQASALV